LIGVKLVAREAINPIEKNCASYKGSDKRSAESEVSKVWGARREARREASRKNLLLMSALSKSFSLTSVLHCNLNLLFRMTLHDNGEVDQGGSVEKARQLFKVVCVGEGMRERYE
jgi:hypothetical protein